MSVLFNNAIAPIKSYIDSDKYTELIINNIGYLYVDDIKGGWIRKSDKNITSEFIKNICKVVATASNQQFNESHTLLSTSLPNSNIRIQAVHHTVLRKNCNSITIRLPNKSVFNLNDFSSNKAIINKIKRAIKSKDNILVSGGTGTGKTSLLNAMIKEISINERIVSIEDSPELHISNENKDQIIISKSGTSLNKLDYTTSLNAVMRMRPDRVFLGEIDTKNTDIFLRLANTGHKGMISTIHSNSVKDAMNAISLNLKLNGFNAESNTIKEFINSSIDVIAQIKRTGNKRSIVEFERLDKILDEN